MCIRDRTLNAVITFFSQDTLAHNDVSSDQVWLPRSQQFRNYSRESHIFIIWALAVILTLKIIATIFSSSAWHSGSWCCIAIPNLVTKCSGIQKISSRQTYTNILNLCCDLDPERSTPLFLQDTLAYETVLSNQVWLQADQQFRICNRNSHILII